MGHRCVLVAIEDVVQGHLVKAYLGPVLHGGTEPIDRVSSGMVIVLLVANA